MTNVMTNEILNEEQLDSVAGGICYEMADDSRFLNSLNDSCDRYGATRIFLDHSRRSKIENAWATVGIKADLSCGLYYYNAYYLNGQKITQEQARQHAMKVVGK